MTPSALADVTKSRNRGRKRKSKGNSARNEREALRVRASDRDLQGPIEGLDQAPLQQQPRQPTHYEPSGSVPGPHFGDPKGRQASGRLRMAPSAGPPAADCGTASRCGGRPYGGPAGALTFGLFGTEGRPTDSLLSTDKRGMERKPKFFTERSLAAYLAVSDRTIPNWIRRGELPSYKLGASRRIDPADVDAFLAERRDEAA